MTSPTDPPSTNPETQAPLETWPASSVYQKIQEMMEDYENGYINEEQVIEFLQELNIKDEEHFLDKMDDYNDELRARLRKIDIANRALLGASIVNAVSKDVDLSAAMQEQQKEALKKELNETLVNIKNPGDAKEVSDGLEKAARQLESMQKGLSAEVGKKAQEHVNSMRDIAMGLRTDYLGATRTSLGTGTVLQGPLGEILGLGFDKLQVEADNDGGKYISGFIADNRKDLAMDLKTTATNVKNRPQLSPPD
jgi:hypothetical protein